MKHPRLYTSAAAALAVVVAASCATGRGGGLQRAASGPVPTTGGEGGGTPADVRFMSGMIPHHAQAVLMAGWAPSHDASLAVRAMCERIVVAQRDEIGLMQGWLRERHQTVPDGDASHAAHAGMDPAMLMPGMLTPEELAQLDRARGEEFDRLFLTLMIRHHQGAVTMVDQLFGAPGAAQDELVFRMASDIYADQTTEIDRMKKMLLALVLEGRGQ